MGQIDIKLTNTPSTPLTGKAGIFISTALIPKLIDEDGNQVPLGGATNFIELLDVPTAYTGQSGKAVTVKVTEDGLEFTTPASAYPEAVERANNTVLFDQDYIIGNAGARSGNILFDFTGAKLGATTEMLHDNSGAYTFPTEGVIRDFETTKLALVTGNVKFGFTLVNKTVSSEVVDIRLSLTETQIAEYNA
jgi:hypothetical protein